MKVLLNKNVPKLGNIGEIVEVKNGHARNYLLPHGLAVAPTEANLRAVEAAKARHVEEVAREKAELAAKAEAVRGKEVTITARANEEGHLYGSVGPAQIAAALAEENIFLDASYIVLDDAIRQLDKYDVQVRFSEEVSATIHVWVVPAHDEDHEDAGDLPAASESPAPTDSGASADDRAADADSDD